MNPDFLNLKEAAEEAEFEEITPTSIKIQNAGLSGTGVPKFDQAQYDAVLEQLTPEELAEIRNQASGDEVNKIEDYMLRAKQRIKIGSAALKATGSDAKRIAKRKAQRKARKSNR